MIEEARHLPPSMVAIAIAFISLFTVLSLGTIVAVMADDTPAAPLLEDLPLVEASRVIDTIQTCTEQACDGYGVLLQATDLDASTLTNQLADHWRDKGWRSMTCSDEGDRCFANEDLRISVRNWDKVDPLLAPTLVEGVGERGLDPARLLYVHYFRCGAIYACE